MKINPMMIGAAMLLLVAMAGGGGVSNAQAMKEATHVPNEGGKVPPPSSTPQQPDKVMPPIPPVGVGTTPGSTYRYGGVPGSSLVQVPPLLVPDYKPQADYITQLFNREKLYKAGIREHYSLPRLKVMTHAAGAYFGVPPSWIWGIMYGESRWHPLGIYAGYRGSAKYAIAKKSSAHGMGQMLRGRWNSEKPSFVSLSEGGAAGVQTNPEAPWETPTVASPSLEHWMLLDPKVSVWSTAASLGRMVHNRGGGPGKTLEDQLIGIQKAARGSGSNIKLKGGEYYKQGSLAVGHWWAGQFPSSAGGARKKTKHILRHGPKVWDDRSQKKAWKKATPAPVPVDWLPPWRTGSLTDQQTAAMMQTLSYLEAAGKDLWTLNPALT